MQRQSVHFYGNWGAGAKIYPHCVDTLADLWIICKLSFLNLSMEPCIISCHLSAVQEKRTVPTVCDIPMHSWKITTQAIHLFNTFCKPGIFCVDQPRGFSLLEEREPCIFSSVMFHSQHLSLT